MYYSMYYIPLTFVSSNITKLALIPSARVSKQAFIGDTKADPTTCLVRGRGGQRFGLQHGGQQTGRQLRHCLGFSLHST